MPYGKTEEYRKKKEKVFDAVYSIAPKTRTIKKIHKVVVCDYNKIEKVRAALRPYVGYKEVAKLELVLAMAKIKTTHYHKYFVGHNISGSYGGVSNPEIGIIAMTKLDSNKVAIGVSIYGETWVEEDYVKINKSKEVWNDEHIEKFLTYQLYQQLQLENYSSCIQL